MLTNLASLVPTAPRDFAIAGRIDSPVLATASWRRPQHPHGVISYYEIICVTLDQRRKRYEPISPPATLELYNRTTHICTIRARTSAGFGPPSDTVTVISGQHCK